MTIQYTPELDRSIRNVQSLPRGTGGKYLLCLHDNGIFIAKKWCHKMPKLIGSEAVIKFGK